MEPIPKNTSRCMRLLGLGNEILTDDAFGILVAREVERLKPSQIEVVRSYAAGFNLLDDLLGPRQLLIVDTIMTGNARPGTIHVFRVDQVPQAPGIAPHCAGLREVLALGRQLHLDIADEAIVIAVEASDCTTIGGEMNADVRLAITRAVDLINRLSTDVGHCYGRV